MTEGSQPEDGQEQATEAVELSTGALEALPSATLVEIEPGVAVVFGELPDVVDLVPVDLVPAFDLDQVSTSLSTLGNAATVAGNVAEKAASIRGLYRLNAETLQLLKSGGEMAVKDGANLGGIFKGGKLVAQARFVPVTMSTAATAAAIGPAIAMMGLQMKLGEISDLVQANLALTKQTLKTIRYEQWAELEGLSQAVEETLVEARALDTITDSVWEPIAPSRAAIKKQLSLYKKNVRSHVKEVKTLEGKKRREYLESNGEAVVFDTHALLGALKTYGEYQALRAALARARGVDDPSEAQLFEHITQTTPLEIEEALQEIREITDSLVRELRVIAELPGRATLPLSGKRRSQRIEQLTCAQLLEAVEPLADILHPATELPEPTEGVCAPDTLELEPYMRLLRWFLDDGEQVRLVAFPTVTDSGKVSGVAAALRARQIDASWDALLPGRMAAVAQTLAPATFVAVTDRRIITASPEGLLRRGELGKTYPLSSVKFVRTRDNNKGSARPTIGIVTEQENFDFVFPDVADLEMVDSLAAIVAGGPTDLQESLPVLEV